MLISGRTQAITERKNMGSSSKGHCQQLLPGIPNEVTIELISPKLPWRAFYILSSVSVAWKSVIQSRTIYDARVRSGATETVVLLDVCRPFPSTKQFHPRLSYPSTGALAMYCPRDKSFCLLPPIPNVRDGFPSCCKHISVNGKVYVLARAVEHNDTAARGEVYVMDVAGQGRWQQCKSMESISEKWQLGFGLGVLGGKIYVFCGSNDYSRSYPHCGGAEVFDPESNTWDRIKFCPYYGPQVLVVEDKFYLYKGLKNDLWTANFSLEFHPETGTITKVNLFRRKVNPLTRGSSSYGDSYFISQGQLHLMTRTGIEVYDTKNESWVPKHIFSCVDITRSLHENCEQWTTITMGDELLTYISWISLYLQECFSLFQSFGFGGQREIVWKKVECPLSIRHADSSDIHPIQL